MRTAPREKAIKYIEQKKVVGRERPEKPVVPKKSPPMIDTDKILMLILEILKQKQPAPVAKFTIPEIKIPAAQVHMDTPKGWDVRAKKVNGEWTMKFRRVG